MPPAAEVSPSSSDAASTRPKYFIYHDNPCLNCGRYGSIPGQMISDALDNTFCAPECGWYHHLRPYYGSAIGAAVTLTRTGTTSRASQKPRRVAFPKSSNSQKSYANPSTTRISDREQTRTLPVSVSKRRPPKFPTRPLSAAEKAAERRLDSGHALLDIHADSGWWREN